MLAIEKNIKKREKHYKLCTEERQSDHRFPLAYNNKSFKKKGKNKKPKRKASQKLYDTPKHHGLIPERGALWV